LIGVLDEFKLLGLLSNQYDQFPEIPKVLNQPEVSLKGRLKNFFEAIEELDRPLLLVLDDFEQNIPKSAVLDRSLRPISEAVKVLTALCGALEETGAVSRLMITCRYECPLPSRRLHLEKNLDRMNATDIDKKCRSLTAYAQVKQHPEYERVLRVADGNPRLLEWLLKLIEAPDVNTAALLSDLEQAELKFREDILAETLLRALTIDEQRTLAKLSVFRLPVSLEIVNAVADGAMLQKPLALSLVESLLRPNQGEEYRVTTILEPLLKPLLTAEEWLGTRQQVARAMYQVWWEEADKQTEVQMREMVRVGLLAQQQEIVVKVGDALATNRNNNYRFLETLELCQEILLAFVDYRILGRIARAEAVLGSTTEATNHYQQALNLCPEDDLKERAATLNNMALMIKDQGEIDRALDLWQQSLDILERIDDVEGKATALSNIAGVIAQKGEIDRALDLWQQSLDILERIDDVQKANILNDMALVIRDQGEIDRALDLWQQSSNILERIGDVHGKAATLNNMATTAFQQGDTPKALEFLTQSAQALGQSRAYVNLVKLVTVLNNLNAISEKGNFIYLAQAVWLCLKVQSPLQQAISILSDLFSAVPQGDELKALLATTAYFLCLQRGTNHPQLTQLQERSTQMLMAAANAQGIAPEAVEAWMAQQQLNDPAVFLPRLNQRLEALVGTGWLFDRGGFSA